MRRRDAQTTLYLLPRYRSDSVVQDLVTQAFEARPRATTGADPFAPADALCTLLVLVSI